MSIRQVARKTSLSEGTVRNLVKRGELPPLVRLTPGRVGLPTQDVERWLKSRLPHMTMEAA